MPNFEKIKEWINQIFDLAELLVLRGALLGLLLLGVYTLLHMAH
jgi:hypothetical protein